MQNGASPASHAGGRGSKSGRWPHAPAACTGAGSEQPQFSSGHSKRRHVKGARPAFQGRRPPASRRGGVQRTDNERRCRRGGVSTLQLGAFAPGARVGALRGARSPPLAPPEPWHRIGASGAAAAAIKLISGLAPVRRAQPRSPAHGSLCEARRTVWAQHRRLRPPPPPPPHGSDGRLGGPDTPPTGSPASLSRRPPW